MPPNHAAHGEDLYALLQVTSTASDVDIKKAYRRLALLHHPDRQTSDKDREAAQEKFAKLSAAYDILSDPLLRKDYDEKECKQVSKKKNTKGTTGATSPTSARAASAANKNVVPAKTPSTSMTSKKKPIGLESKEMSKKSPSSTMAPSTQKKVSTAQGNKPTKIPVIIPKTKTKPVANNNNNNGTVDKSRTVPKKSKTQQPNTVSWSRNVSTSKAAAKPANPPKKHAPTSQSVGSPPNKVPKPKTQVADNSRMKLGGEKKGLFSRFGKK